MWESVWGFPPILSMAMIVQRLSIGQISQCMKQKEKIFPMFITRIKLRKKRN